MLVKFDPRFYDDLDKSDDEAAAGLKFSIQARIRNLLESQFAGTAEMIAPGKPTGRGRPIGIVSLYAILRRQTYGLDLIG